MFSGKSEAAGPAAHPLQHGFDAFFRQPVFDVGGADVVHAGRIVGDQVVAGLPIFHGPDVLAVWLEQRKTGARTWRSWSLLPKY